MRMESEADLDKAGITLNGRITALETKVKEVTEWVAKIESVMLGKMVDRDKASRLSKDGSSEWSEILKLEIPEIPMFVDSYGRCDTLSERIAVMQAAERGKEIERTSRGDEDWHLCLRPTWNWYANDYRVAGIGRATHKPVTPWYPDDSGEWVESTTLPDVPDWVPMMVLSSHERTLECCAHRIKPRQAWIRDSIHMPFTIVAYRIMRY